MLTRSTAEKTPTLRPSRSSHGERLNVFTLQEMKQKHELRLRDLRDERASIETLSEETARNIDNLRLASARGTSVEKSRQDGIISEVDALISNLGE